ncbi:hypothetical protein [Litorimonas haliclonae]|uniref:hypothetical protein n=1 Tax=Litorimonas haliclonae TaxID=2081977 RepID=UPI0039F04AC4
MTERKPLFVPLKTKYYEQFEAGVKVSEMRPYGPRWNERTCFVGRPVTLSKGYGKQNRISGVITRFRRTTPEHLGAAQNDWIAVYGEDRNDVAEIFIRTELSQ